jgi:hypothetical protein
MRQVCCIALKELMDAFRVLICRLDGETCLRVEGLDNTNWLLHRLSDLFVFKTCEPLRELSNAAYAFRVAHTSLLSGQQFEKLLAGISEVKLIVEPMQPAWQAARET